MTRRLSVGLPAPCSGKPVFRNTSNPGMGNAKGSRYKLGKTRVTFCDSPSNIQAHYDTIMPTMCRKCKSSQIYHSQCFPR
ncbi:unnamed protein product [Tuber melanosporum]|uniref:(Perigord truffle) hypothetical protein n=1 Tax=Tuber melanosporum (strain Mel28) TaxID=656061 RepID=D5G982_TUBMM|nr:uncharacterized protein GSTUM_00003190001 [Tuber melanosporum]CAZ81075.1 unnamed protein product [Tuber melanosporum]